MFRDTILFIDSDTSVDGFRGVPAALDYLSKVSNGLNIIKSPTILFDPNLYRRLRSIVFRNHASPQTDSIIRELKRHSVEYGFKIVYVYDQPFYPKEGGKSVYPDYISDRFQVNDAQLKSAMMLMRMSDTIVVNDEDTKRFVRGGLGMIKDVEVFGQYVSRNFMGSKESKITRQNILYGRVVYVASKDDFTPGDPNKTSFDESFIKWMHKKMSHDRWFFTCIHPKGLFPTFFDGMKKLNNFESISVNSHDEMLYELKMYRAHFGIIPMQDNEFYHNYPTGRFKELYSAGTVAIARKSMANQFLSYIDNPVLISDYESDTLDDRIEALMKKDNFNSVLNQQFTILDQQNSWIENRANELLKCM